MPEPASAALTAATLPHQRARGTLRLALKRRDGATVLDALRQEGCLKVRFPRTEQDAWAGAVTLNTAGGIAGGDQLSTCIKAGPGTAATIASQAAERVYRALPGTVADVSTSLHVAAGAALEWLPQETILFDRCAARRRLEVELAGDAWFLGVEQLVFGRTAMGETVRSASFRDLIQLRRDGRLILHDAIRLDGPVQALLDRAATGNGARATATLVHAAPGAAWLLDPLRAALAGWEAGASAWDGMLVARVVAADGACLRRAVVAGLNVLRDGRPLPRVWLC
jgi:urease accessory protein